MSANDPLLSLSMPFRRDELILYLRELAVPDPRPLWRAETERGLTSNIDQVFHFFFDDNDFDETAIGVTLTNSDEVSAIENLKVLLEAILQDVGDASDDEFVHHPLWPRVATAAAIAANLLQ